jgi:hypothetical protein
MDVVADLSEKNASCWPGEEEAAVSSEEENKALVRRFMEARVNGDLDAVDEMLAPTSSTIIKCSPG